MRADLNDFDLILTSKDYEDRTTADMSPLVAGVILERGVSTSDVFDTYGPNWVHLGPFLHSLTRITKEDARKMEAAQKQGVSGGPDSYWAMTRQIAERSVVTTNRRLQVIAAANTAVRIGTETIGGSVARGVTDAIEDAATAIVIRDLAKLAYEGVGFTRERYNDLAAVANSVDLACGYWYGL